MKILMIAPQPFFEPRGTPFSVLGRLKALSSLGHEIDLVTYHIGQDVPIQNVVIHRIPSIFFIKRISIGPSVTKLFLDGFLLAKTVQMLFRNSYDLVHTHEEASFFGFMLAKLFNIRHLYDMHSSLPQQLGNFQYSKFAPLIHLFRWFEETVIHSSHAVITICPALKEQVEKINTGVPHVMIENVSTEGDPQAVPANVIQEFKQQYALEGRKVVLYSGTLESYQGLDLLFLSAKVVSRIHKDVLFLIMGGRPDQLEACQHTVAQLGLEAHVRFTGMQAPSEVLKATAACDVLVSPRISGTNTPLKIYSYLQSGKPIVATDLYTHTQVLSRDVAVLAAPEDEAFGKGICQMLEDLRYAQTLGRNARALFDRDYSYDTFLQKTNRVIQLAMR